jgi:hypothetical protein
MTIICGLVLLFTIVALYFLIARMDITFDPTHGSIGFPSGGTIEANVTLTSQAVPGEFFRRECVNRTTRLPDYQLSQPASQPTSQCFFHNQSAHH